LRRVRAPIRRATAAIDREICGSGTGSATVGIQIGFEQSHSDIEIVTLRRALATLSEDYREPLLLQVIGGYSCEEIAEIMGLQPGAVMTRLSRARQKLRLKLEGNDKTTVNSCI
jgi:DNA-directed RNA polymerase specialized sigma24 family protein